MIINPSRYEEFVFTVKTNNPGTSNSTSFTLPLRTTGTVSYNYTVEWGDGVTEAFTGTTARTHNYGIAGTYQIRITGSFVGHVFFNNGGDKSKVLSVTKNSLVNNSLENSYNGCNNLTSYPFARHPGVTNLNFAWLRCSSLTSVPDFNVDSVTSAGSTWALCTNLASFPALDFKSVTNLFNAWASCPSLTSFPAIKADLCREFRSTWQNCSSLVTFPPGVFDTWNPSSVSGVAFLNAWDGCTSLSATSVENILVSIDTSGKTALSYPVTIDYNVAAGGLTSATTTAITSLKAKGWVININGVNQ